MIIELMDYQDKKVTFDIGNIEDIVSIIIEDQFAKETPLIIGT